MNLGRELKKYKNILTAMKIKLTAHFVSRTQENAQQSQTLNCQPLTSRQPQLQWGIQPKSSVFITSVGMCVNENFKKYFPLQVLFAPVIVQKFIFFMFSIGIVE